jgi:PAS domain S-box-containing protein
MRRMVPLSVTRYALATLAAVVALLFREALNPLFGHQNPYHTMWLAIVFSAWYCGLGPSIVTAGIGAVGIWYWFLPPYNSLLGKSSTAISGMLGFLAFSAVIVALGESSRRVIIKRQRAEQELRKAQEELEQRVRERTAALERRTAEVVEKATLLDLANDAILVKSPDGTISYWNRGAERLYGWTRAEALGRSPHQLLSTEFPVPLSEIESGDGWEGELHHVKRDGSRIVVASRWTTMRDRHGDLIGWLEINTDITARKSAEAAARSLTGRLLTLQDEERRRIARGLHDSLGQYLAALKMNLDTLATANGSQPELAGKCAEMVDTCLTETRTISHLLHPPLLDEAGLNSAARWYVDGFAQRSGIKVSLSMPAELRRLPGEVEIALFRALQESLTNVHRHSGASEVAIRLTMDAYQVQLQIRDNGCGIAPQRLKRLADSAAEAGVGLAGMRERVRELGGLVEIQSDPTGTVLKVSIPISEIAPETAIEPAGDNHDSTRPVSAA